MGEFQHKESGYIATWEEIFWGIQESYPIYLKNFDPRGGSPAMTHEEFAKWTWSLYDQLWS